MKFKVGDEVYLVWGSENHRSYKITEVDLNDDYLPYHLDSRVSMWYAENELEWAILRDSPLYNELK